MRTRRGASCSSWRRQWSWPELNTSGDLLRGDCRNLHNLCLIPSLQLLQLLLESGQQSACVLQRNLWRNLAPVKRNRRPQNNQELEERRFGARCHQESSKSSHVCSAAPRLIWGRLTHDVGKFPQKCTKVKMSWKLRPSCTDDASPGWTRWLTGCRLQEPLRPRGGCVVTSPHRGLQGGRTSAYPLLHIQKSSKHAEIVGLSCHK